MDARTLTFLDAIILGILGRLLMFLWLKQPVSQWIASKIPVIKAMFDCDLCLGTWTYWLLAILFNKTLFEGFNIPILSAFFVGVFMTFIAYLVRIGWEVRFTEIHVEG